MSAESGSAPLKSGTLVLGFPAQLTVEMADQVKRVVEEQVPWVDAFVIGGVAFAVFVPRPS